jgi:arsenical pump membrane protein
VQLADFVDLATRVGPILVFLIAITVVAELADGIGLFAIIARWAAVLGRGSVLGLWLLVVLVATVATAVLSLDTTAVLLTPVVLVLARRLGLGQELFAFTAVWLANTASLILPVSNLTNLLAYARLRPAGVAFTPLMWAPALAVWVVTVALLGVVFRRRLRGRYEVPKPFPVDDRGLLLVGGVVCAGLGPAFVLGADVSGAAVVGALILVIACLLRRPRLVGWRLLPWPLVLGVSVLFVLVEIAHAYGLTTPVTELVGQGDTWTDLLRLAGISALAANLLNNLPAYLAVEPSALDSPLRLAALLVGVNAGPLITPWASLATLLWAGRCRAAGLQVSWLRFAGLGAVLVPLCLLAGTGALALNR